ncbi:MAG: phosphatidate cytidylyltransferase [Synergistaceae bacterium]|nr:phosphatidate cytidylyltransferase [Synergistaceae bacterium]
MAPLKSKEVARRAVSGAFVVAAVLSGIWYGSWLWVTVVSFFSMISLFEFYRIISTRTHLSKGVGYIAAILVLISTTEGLHPISISLTLALSAFIILMIEIIRRQSKGVSDAMFNVGGTLSGILYVTIPWCFMLLLRDFPTGRLILISLFLCTWGCDVASYIIGSRWGHHILCNRISPNKTFEGFLGGLAGSIFTAGVLVFALEQGITPILWIGIVCGTLGQMGDLAESLLKREAGIKDSGSLIPGHGGALDRFDSILINGLFTYVLCIVIYS